MFTWPASQTSWRNGEDEEWREDTRLAGTNYAGRSVGVSSGQCSPPSSTRQTSYTSTPARVLSAVPLLPLLPHLPLLDPQPTAAQPPEFSGPSLPHHTQQPPERLCPGSEPLCGHTFQGGGGEWGGRPHHETPAHQVLPEPRKGGGEEPAPPDQLICDHQSPRPPQAPPQLPQRAGLDHLRGVREVSVCGLRQPRPPPLPLAVQQLLPLLGPDRRGQHLLHVLRQGGLLPLRGEAGPRLGQGGQLGGESLLLLQQQVVSPVATKYWDWLKPIFLVDIHELKFPKFVLCSQLASKTRRQNHHFIIHWHSTEKYEWMQNIGSLFIDEAFLNFSLKW